MIISALLHWWYVEGWFSELKKIHWSFVSVADYFSIGLLVKTLFAPFRQISATANAKNSGGAFNAFTDRLVSRSIGFVVRFITIIVGLLSLLILLIFSFIRLIVWILLPILPIVGLSIMLSMGDLWT